MKPVTALFLLSLSGLGAGCSLTTPEARAETVPAEAAPATVVETAEVQGTLNLKIGRTNDGPGGLNIGANTASSSGGQIVGPGGTGGNFEDVAGLGIDLEDAPETILEAAPVSDEDAIVRLPEQN